MTVGNERLKFLMEEMNKQDLKEEINKEIKKAEFLVPVVLPEHLKNQSMVKGEFTIDEETPASIKPLEDSDGNIYLPVFTDSSEVRKSNEDITALVFDIETIKELVLKENDELHGIIINPFSEYILTVSREDALKI